MGKVRYLFDVKETELGVAGEFAVQKPGVLVDLFCPFIDVGRIRDPAAFDVSLLHQAN